MQACSLEPAEDLVARIEMEKQPTLIFSGEYTKAMDENYHKDHLACHNCDKKLVACRYIVKDENPHCIPCYQELYAHNCEECKKPIGPITRTCHTRTGIGMNSASSAASARNLWWINPSLQRMTTSTAPIVTIKTSLLAAMGVGNHSEEG